VRLLAATAYWKGLLVWVRSSRSPEPNRKPMLTPIERVVFDSRISSRYLFPEQRQGTGSKTRIAASWSPIACDATYNRLSFATYRDVPEPGRVLALEIRS